MRSRIWRQILDVVIWIYLLLLFERSFHKDLKIERSFELCLSNQKI